MNLGKYLTLTILILLPLSPVLGIHYWPWSSYPMYSWKLSSDKMIHYEMEAWVESKKVQFSKMEIRRVSYLLLQKVDLGEEKLQNALPKLLSPEFINQRPRIEVVRWFCKDKVSWSCNKKKEVVFNGVL